MAKKKAPANAGTLQGKEHPIHLKAQKRFLQFLNAATSPKDLMVAPNDRIYIDEEEAHTDHVDHHNLEAKPLFNAELARCVFEARELKYPIHGFGNAKEVLAIDRRIAKLLRDFILRFSKGIYGSWDLLYPLDPGGVDFEIEHAALLRSYKVIFLADGTDTVIWDPADEVTPLFSKLSGATTGLTANLLCSGHSFLSDGKLLCVGGGGFGPNNPTSDQAWKFDPMTETWTKTAGDMSKKRWYPTAMTLGDEAGPTGSSGRVLVAAGWPNGNPVMEVYSEATDSFSPLVVNGTTTHSMPQTYPSLHLLPGGEVFYVPTGFGNCSRGSVYSLSDPASYFTFTPNGSLNGHWTDVDSAMNRTKGMSALIIQPNYPNVRAIVVGGGDSSAKATLQMINLSTFSPTWGAPVSIPDGRDRINVNVVLLPDGTVFVSGGLSTPPYTSYIFDPNAVISPWTEVDTMNAPRHYHSCTLLLSNGKVMAAGGAAPGGCTASVENTIEVFSPPYLFNADGTPAARPSIVTIDGTTPTTTVAPTVHHGAIFDIETPDANDIARVVLMRPMAVTHNTDTEQRLIQCTFWQSDANTIRVQAPDGGHPHAIAPRQYYMLFILNSKLVPSEGKFIHLH